MVLYVPMMTLLLFILVVSSERVLKEMDQSRLSPGLVLKKAIQKPIAQLRKQVATIYPTPFRKYSRKRISVNKVSPKEAISRKYIQIPRGDIRRGSHKRR
jgi:hypothetical protein